MYPPDQALRQAEMPPVDTLGNQQIFEFIVSVAKEGLNSRSSGE